MIALPMREWLELGQALNDKRILAPRYFRADHTHMIEIGAGLSVKANRKIYKAGRYYLDRTLQRRDGRPTSLRHHAV